MTWVFKLLLGATIGGRAVRLILSRHDELRRLKNIALLVNLMCVGYPAFQVLFNHTSRTMYFVQYELPVLLMLHVPVLA